MLSYCKRFGIEEKEISSLRQVKKLDFIITHLIANYNHLGKPGPGDRYLAHRAAQSYELARFVSSTSRNNLVVVCGDFNAFVFRVM